MLQPGILNCGRGRAEGVGATASGEALEGAIRAALAPLPGTVAVMAEDLQTGAGIAIGAATALPAASVIKVPILVALTRAAALGRLSLDQEIEVDAALPDLRDGEDGSGVLRHLRPHHRWSLRELAILMHMVSDNIATNALIAALGGFAPVNDLLDDLGITDSRLDAAIQDFEVLQTRNLVTAADMVRLLRALHERTVPGADEALRIMREQVYNSIIPALLPDGTEVLHKTGSLRGVLNDIALVYPAGDRARGHAIALLSSGQAPDAAARAALSRVSLLVYEAFAVR